MASSLNIQVDLEKSKTQLDIDAVFAAARPKREVQALIKELYGLLAGTQRGSVKVQTGAAAAVRASATQTLATVIATDATTVGGNVFTFSAGAPATENDVNVTIGSAKAFASSTDIDVATGIITESTHGFLTGDVCQVSTSSVLPAGISASTDYYIIKLDADTYSLATSYANALAGTKLRPTDAGTGNQTVTIQADKTHALRLAAAYNAHSTIGQVITASVSGAVVTVTHNIPGVVGNFFPIADQDTTITTSSAFLTGGLGGAQNAPVTYSLGI